MNPFEFSIPQNIIVGAGTLSKLPECAKKMGGTHAMILSGPTLKKMGVVDKAADSLKAAGIAADIFTEIEANPSVTTVEKATESYLSSAESGRKEIPYSRQDSIQSYLHHRSTPSCLVLQTEPA